MSYQPFSFYLDHFFQRKKILRDSYILHNRHFQLIVFMGLLLFLHYSLDMNNQELRKKIALENKKLKAIRSI